MLKQLIQRLLDSRTTPAQAAYNAMPSGSSVAIQAYPTSVKTWTQVASYTAPTDGYISVRGMSLESGSVLQIMAGDHNANPSITASAASGGQWPQTVLPVSKGRNVAVYSDKASNISVFFSKAIGGGGGVSALKNALLQGGVLCRLSRLYSSLRRSSCRVRERGFNMQSVHHSRRPTSLSLKTMRGTLLRPVRTVTLRSQETPRVSFWKFPQAARGLLIAEHLRGDTSFLSQKVSHSHTWCHLIQLLTRFILSQCRLKTNSAVGGASC